MKFKDMTHNINPVSFIGPVFIEESTIQELFNVHVPHMLRFASERFGVGGGDVQDIIQDSFEVLLNQEKKSDLRDSKAFMFGVFRNKLREFCRARNKQNRLVNLEDALPECQKAAFEDTQLLQELAECQQERISQMLNLMDVHLQPDENTILRMRFFDKLSYAEISTKTGKSEVAVRQIASRSKKRLKLLMR